MDSIARRGAGIVRSLDAVHGKVSRLSTRFAAWGVCLLALMLALPVSATSYVYDANGRLIAVTNDAGESARYVYDVMGNIQKVDRLAADQLALFSVTPGRGVSGMQVRLQGHAFSANAGANLVRFSGVTAAVLTASSSELVVIVPVGAVTGPVSVTVGAQTATSSTDFIVDQNARTPRIDGISPQVASAGTTIKVTGESLFPVAYQTTARIGTRAGVIGAAQNAELDFVVPAFAASGKVSVSTPYGMAVSTQDLFVLPSGIAAANIASFRRIAPDAPASAFSISTTGQQVAILVDAGAGEHLDAQFSEISAGNLGYTLYDPSNRQVVSGTVNTGNPTVLLPPAASVGTYLLLIKPAQGPANWNLAIERSRKIAPGDESVQLTTSIAGQRKRFVFSAATDQRLGLGLEELAVSSGTVMFASVTSRDTTVVSSTCYVRDGGCELNIRATQSAMHAIAFSPNTATQTFQAKVSLSNDMRLPLQREVPLDLVVPRRGQNARLFFSAQAGESLALQVMSQTTLPTGRIVNYAVYKPDGTLLTSANATTHQLLNLPSVPQSGEYFVFVDGDYGATSSSRVLLSEGSTGGGQVGGDAGEFETQSGGQSIYFNFTVSEVDQRVGVGISDLVLNSGAYVNVNVYRPDGASVGSSICYATNGGCDVNVRAPMVGRYSVIVKPINAAQTMRLNAWVSNDLQAVMPRETPVQLVIPRRGQNARLKFNAEAGEYLAVQIAGQSSSGNANVSYTVYKPDGTELTKVSTTAFENLRMMKLPASGEYLIFVDPYYGAAMQSRVLLTAGNGGDAIVDGSVDKVATDVGGQATFTTFEVDEVDQRIGIGISDLLVSSGAYATVNIYRPNGSSVVSSICYQSYNGCDLNLRAPEAGTYGMVVTPQNATQILDYALTVSNDLHRTLPRETTIAFDVPRRGQNARLTFNAQAGETLGLQIAGQSTLPAARAVSYQVYKPDGTSLTSRGVTNFDTLNLPTLPASGDYMVFVDPKYGAAVTAQLRLTTGEGTGTEIDGPPGEFSTTQPGQPTYMTFQAAAGEQLSLGISDLVVSNGTYVNVNVYRPGGASAASTNCYVSNPGCALNISAVDGGTYSVVTTPQSASQTAQFKATLSRDLRLTLARNEPLDLVMPRRGQRARLSFVGRAGDALALQVAGQSTFPAGRTVYYRVYKPDGTALKSMSATSFGALELRLPAVGTYQVLVETNYGETVSGRITLAESAVQPVDGGHDEVETSVGGQSMHSTFQATAGEKLGVGIYDLAVSSGSYVSVEVYRPDGTSAVRNSCYRSYNGCRLAVSTTQTGIYSVAVTPQSGTQTMSYKHVVSRDLVGVLTRNQPLDLVVSRRGQAARLTFTGEAGDALALQVAGQSTFPSARATYYRVYKPDGSSLKSFSATAFGAQELRLPVDGTYQVLVETSYGETLSSRMTLAQGEAQPVNGQPGEIQTNVGGQSVHATFQATSGQRLGVGIFDLLVSSGSYASVEVYRPDGTSAVSTTCYQSSQGCKLPVTATQSGTYSIVVTPQSATQTLSYKLAVSQELTGVLARDQPLDLVISRRGQNARLTFAGQAGQWLSLQIAGQTTVPAARAIHYRVYRPDATQLTSVTATAYDALRLPALPATGEYTVLVDPGQGEAVQSQLTLASGASTLALDGGQAAVSTEVGGQEIFLAFNATAGQRVGIGLRDIQLSSGTYFNAETYHPDGSIVTAACYAQYGGCEMDVTANADGVYRLFVKPQGSTQKIQLTATASTDVQASLERNVLFPLSLARPGQNGWIGFEGASGESLSLQMTDHTTQPSGGNISYVIYKPDGTSLTSANINSSRVLQLPTLTASGTYRIRVNPNYGMPFDVGLTLK